MTVAVNRSLLVENLTFNIVKTKSLYGIGKSFALYTLVAEKDNSTFDGVEYLFLGRKKDKRESP